MGGVWEIGEVHNGSWWENLEERGHLGALGIVGRIKLNLIFTYEIDLAQDRDRWWVLVNSVINFLVP